MKKLILPFIVLVVMAFSQSCKKCFRCYNECVQCNIVVNNHTFGHVLCKDSFNTTQQYEAAISADTSLGYTCFATAPTYNYEFCVNQPGKESYLNYYNKGKKVTCDEK
ncbi:MAG: hypothetical protein KIS94_13720 [Chitinophagales bacterium]|nr:hypothetical protein [Chitinophagales bacterium]